MMDFNQMDGLEIFTKIEGHKKRIEDLIDPTTFVLNPEIEQLQKEIMKLQQKCPHCYIECVCKYCGKEEK